jgi:hypothetical protein
LEPESGTSRITCWAGNRWDSFGLVPIPGQAIASLRFDCLAGGDTTETESGLTCWAGAVSRHDSRSQMLLEERWTAAAEEAAAPLRELAVDVPSDHDVLFLRIENLESVEIRATLRRRSRDNDVPRPGSTTPSRTIPAEDIVLSTSPFRPLDDQPHELINWRLGAASSVVRTQDGQFLLALGGEGIELFRSTDGKEWSGPADYEHNGVFPTRCPALTVDDDGIVWMAYLSKRPSYDIYSSGSYYLYRTSSEDGKTWSRPEPILTQRLAQYQQTPFLTRDPDGEFHLFLEAQTATAAAPGDLSPTDGLYVPVREEWVPQDVHAVFDDRGRCHIVYTDPRGRVHYSHTDRDGIWRVNMRLDEIESMHVNTPQIILKGDRVAVLYWASSGLWFHRGQWTEDGPRLGPAEQIMDHRFSGQGVRLMRLGDEVYLPLPARPPLLLRARLADLL